MHPVPLGLEVRAPGVLFAQWCPSPPQSLVREPLSRRRQLLREHFVETEGEFVFATSLDTKDIEQIAEFLEQSVKGEAAALPSCKVPSLTWPW